MLTVAERMIHELRALAEHLDRIIVVSHGGTPRTAPYPSRVRTPERGHAHHCRASGLRSSQPLPGVGCASRAGEHRPLSLRD